MSFSVLRLDQLIGPNKLDLFNKIEIDAETTGYANLRGADSYKLTGKYFARKGREVKSDLLDKVCAPYWTSTKADRSIGKTLVINGLDAHGESAWKEDIGVRVCVPFGEISSKARDLKTVNTEKGEVKEFIYGEMPQRRIKHEESEELWKKYESGELKPTGKSYSSWGYGIELFYDGADYKFEKDEFPEFEMDGHKYVMANVSTYDNGSSRKYWVEVEPIEWYLDEQSGLAISKKVLLGGIPLSRTGLHLGRFENTIVSRFLNEEFKFDIQEKKLTKEQELNEMIQEEPEEEIIAKKINL